MRKQAKTLQRKATLTVKELREYLAQYQDEDPVRFFTEKGTREFLHIRLIVDDMLYSKVVIIEVD